MSPVSVEEGAMSLRPVDQHSRDDFSPGAPRLAFEHDRSENACSSRRAFLAATASALVTAGTARAEESPAMPHVVLLGDSIFDNAAYVGGGPDVVRQLQDRLPQDWRSSLAALDGSTISDIHDQLAQVPADTTHLVISIGGNDALGQAEILGAPSVSVADTMLQLADIQQAFRAAYSEMIDAVLRLNLPTAICTIYDPRYPDPIQRRVATTALAVLNDCILREAASRGLPLIDLRVVCDEDADFANPIEPSVQGGAKIATAIASLVTQHDFGSGRSQLFVR
jgi:lysophospholipase L1-like esterase